MHALLDELTRLEIELAWLAAQIDAELGRLVPGGTLLRPQRPGRPRRYAQAARRPRPGRATRRRAREAQAGQRV